jgi:hypothetical protein
MLMIRLAPPRNLSHFVGGRTRFTQWRTSSTMVSPCGEAPRFTASTTKSAVPPPPTFRSGIRIVNSRYDSFRLHTAIRGCSRPRRAGVSKTRHPRTRPPPPLRSRRAAACHCLVASAIRRARQSARQTAARTRAAAVTDSRARRKTTTSLHRLPFRQPGNGKGERKGTADRGRERKCVCVCVCVCVCCVWGGEGKEAGSLHAVHAYTRHRMPLIKTAVARGPTTPITACRMMATVVRAWCV